VNRQNPLKDLLPQFRGYFFFAAFFSLFINLTLLLPMIYMLQVFDRVLTSRSVETLLMLTLVTVIGLVTMFLLDYVRVRLMQVAGDHLDRLLGKRVVGALVESSARVVRSEYVHGLRDVATLRAFLTGPAVIALFDTPWLPVFLVVIWFFHPALGAIALTGSLALLAVALLNEKLNRKPLEAIQEQSRRAGRLIDAGLRNADVLNGMGMTPAFAAKWEAMNEEVLRQGQYTGSRMGFIGAFTKFLRQLIYIAMLGGGAYLVVAQDVTPGVMMAATILLSRALAPMESLIGNWRGLVAARLAYAHLDEHLPAGGSATATTALPPPRGYLRVENVALSGLTPDHPIIRHAAFELQPGESLAILGPSAAGKSSLAKLIVGVWKPSVGHVRLDGADITQWPREALGRYVGYLPQDVELLPGTVAENIARLGPVDGDAVVAAAQRSHAHHMILQLPKGYETLIGEGGIQLSAGQAQRVGLARALYGNPRLVVLDEPNANLDAEGEDALLRTLRTLHDEGATTVMITHRPSLVGSIDKLLVLAAGRMERFGPRDEVLAAITPPAAGARPHVAAVPRPPQAPA
jgi:PrtD family type I secretion system ABC transporter